jgi:hypothetical protein
MTRKILFLLAAVLVFGSCDKPSRVAQYKAEKHQRDSVALVQQTQSLTYYQSQLAELMPVADSLMAFFSYEKNPRFQDHGYYIVKPSAVGRSYSDLRVMVRDDGKESILLYRDGKRITGDGLRGKDQAMIECAQHLQIVISDIRECEKRIAHTSKEVQKYEKRLQKQ